MCSRKIGIFFALFQIFSALGSKRADWLEKKLGFRNTLFYFLIPAINFALLSFFESYFMILLIFIDSKIRATVLSVANMIRSLFFVLLAPVFGKVVEVYSLSTGYLGLSMLFFGFVLVITLLIIRNREKKIKSISF